MKKREAVSHFLTRFLATKIARNRQVGDVIFDRCRTTSDLFRTAVNHLAFVLRLPKTFYLTSVMLELTNHCNLSCKFCPSKTMKRPKGFLDPGLAERVLRSCSNLQYVYLYDWGEPLLHPDVCRIVKTASTLGHRTFMVTNGTLLTPKLSEDLIRSGLSTITFSIDGLDEVYASLRGFDYSLLEQKVVEFLEIKERLNPDVRVEINYVVSRDTESQIEQFRSVWLPRVNHITFQPMLTYQQTERSRPCRELWKGTLVVLWDGSVVPCCVDYDAVLKVGDAREDDIGKMLNSAPLVRLRRDHSTSRFCSLCRTCSEYETTQVDGRFDGRLADSVDG